ncbi:hypothetical protein [uncultured Marivita sp.]|uniref:hypothetical protein n=1 Tax=Marivita sp. TaxID=2003365 RepID=UPI000D7AAAF5|nr:hypothetical protein [uncultured Marivita sp.]PWL34185.1 MAG: hypothetical protein DCO97_15870 [Marivita sp. XM-24bin2]
MIFRLRDLLAGQWTETINALRGDLAEFGLILGKGGENIDKLRTVHQMAQLCFAQIDDLCRRIAGLDARIAAARKISGMLWAMITNNDAADAEATRSIRVWSLQASRRVWTDLNQVCLKVDVVQP